MLKKGYFILLLIIILFVLVGCDKKEKLPPTVDKAKLIVETNQSIQDAVDARRVSTSREELILMPSKGNVNVLVIPIQFPNDTFTTEELEIIEYAYFGDGSKFETLKSFYYKSSYGALNISGSVLDPVTANNNYAYYEDYKNPKNSGEEGIEKLLREAINYYREEMPDFNLADYDSNNDGAIDAVQLVYSAPVEFSKKNEFWGARAHVPEPLRGSDYFKWGDYNISSLVFQGVDLFTQGMNNAWSPIHETGHLLGLPDYYDMFPGNSNEGGLGGVDPMDAIAGDHNPFSKLLLDWIDPIVVTKSSTIIIDKYSLNGDSILVTNNFDSIFDEYFVMYYLKQDSTFDYAILNESGLFMYHVDTGLPTEGYYHSNFHLLNNDNSSTDQKLIKVVEANGNTNISDGNLVENDDLLKEGQSYVLRLSDGKKLCKVTVIEMMEETIKISFKFYQ